MNHTPAPWILHQGLIYGANSQCRGYLIAQVFDNCAISQAHREEAQYIDMDEGATNAKLIAAAPDLLCEAQNALVLLKLLSHPGKHEGAIIRRLEQAITKATS